jgi:hypothetical protein
MCCAPCGPFDSKLTHPRRLFVSELPSPGQISNLVDICIAILHQLWQLIADDKGHHAVAHMARRGAVEARKSEANHLFLVPQGRGIHEWSVGILECFTEVLLVDGAFGVFDELNYGLVAT